MPRLGGAGAAAAHRARGAGALGVPLWHAVRGRVRLGGRSLAPTGDGALFRPGTSFGRGRGHALWRRLLGNGVRCIRGGRGGATRVERASRERPRRTSALGSHGVRTRPLPRAALGTAGVHAARADRADPDRGLDRGIRGVLPARLRQHGHRRVHRAAPCEGRQAEDTRHPRAPRHARRTPLARRGDRRRARAGGGLCGASRRRGPDQPCSGLRVDARLHGSRGDGAPPGPGPAASHDAAGAHRLARARRPSLSRGRADARRAARRRGRAAGCRPALRRAPLRSREDLQQRSTHHRRGAKRWVLRQAAARAGGRGEPVPLLCGLRARRKPQAVQHRLCAPGASHLRSNRGLDLP